MGAVVFPKDILIENEFPHMTLLLNNWPAVNTNFVVGALCGENRPLHDKY
jgi:hypothetical protein